MIRFTLFISVCAPFLYGQITLSEIMVNPQGLETANEYVEVYLLGGESVSLNGWVLSDGSGTDTLIHWLGPDSISSASFGIILDPDYDTDNGIYSEQLSNSIPIFTSATDGSLGSGGFTNSGESVILISPSGDTLSQFTWHASPPNGYSFEKILLTAGDDDTNWVITTSENGTPGSINSVTPPLVNCALDSILIFSLPTNTDEGALVHIYLHNGGLQNLDSVQIVLGLDANQDSTIQSAEPISEMLMESNLAWRDTASFLVETPLLGFGVNRMIVSLSVPDDTQLSDNELNFEINLQIPSGLIQLNEILFQPGSGGTEFIELINMGSDTLNLQRWKIRDATNSTGIFPDHLLKLAPQQFAVVAPNHTIEPLMPSAQTLFIVPSAWPSLNNTTDSIRISDSGTRRLVTAWYSNGWGGGSGISLERRATWLPINDPENWGSCISADGNTAGANNSIVRPQVGASLRLQTTPENPRRLDEIQVSTQIIGQGQYSSTNGLITLFFDSEEIASQSVIIPGFEDTTQYIFENLRLRMGWHYLDVNLSGAVNISLNDSVLITPQPGDVRINEFLPWPNSGDPEWVELASHLDESIPMNVLSLGDGSQLRSLSGYDSIPPYGFMVISEFIPEFECGVVPDSWPGYTNSTDEVVLGDAHSNRLDSLYYSTSWHITQGASMERIWPDSSTESLNNWAVNTSGGSPCEMNLATPRPVDLMVSTLQFSHERLLRGESDSVAVTIRNNGFEPSLSANLNWTFDGNSNAVSIPSITGFDSVTTPLLLNFAHGGFQPIQISINSEDDADTTNNIFNDTIAIGYPTGCVAINEISATPPDIQPEYVELVSLDTGQIDLTGWSIRDAGQQRHPFNVQDTIRQNEYLVLTASNALDSYFDLQNIALIVPESWPTLNNITDSVVILDATGHSVAQIGYNTSWGNIANASLERRAIWLAGQNGDNWGSCSLSEDGTPGQENSIAYPAYRVVIDSVGLPESADYDDPLEISIAFSGEGHFSESGEIRISMDGEFRQSQTIAEIRFGETTIQVFTLNPGSPGQHQLELTYTGFSSAQLDTSFWIGLRPKDIILNEVMVWPDAGEPEWVELFNRSDQTIPFSLLGIGDYSHIVWCDTLANFEPGDYITLVQENRQGSCEIQIGNWPGFGNQSDMIQIADRGGTVIDNLIYDTGWDLDQGNSLERIWPDSATNSSDNWATHPDFGTPCVLNISTPNQIDLEMVSIGFDTTTCRINTESEITFRITNLGYQINSPDFLEVAINPGSTGTFSIDLPTITPGDTTELQYSTTWEFPGRYLVQAWLNLSDDANALNDTIWTDAYVSYPVPSLLINEIMYLPSAGNPEWFEVYNAFTDTIDLANWSVADATDVSQLSADSSFFIPPGEYGIIQTNGSSAMANSFILMNSLNLNNSGDFIGLIDPLGNVMDSLTFAADWGGREGVSLERIRLTGLTGNAKNWGSSVANSGSTPGEQNSLFLVNIPDELTLNLSPNPFSPDGDGFEDAQVIDFTLPFESGNISAEIFDVMGRRMATLAKNQPVAAIGELVWDGSWDYSQSIRMGIYILKFQADDHQGHVYERLVKTYVARR